MLWTDRSRKGLQDAGRGSARIVMAALGGCLALALVPNAWLMPVRDLAYRALQPSQHAVQRLRSVCRAGMDRAAGCMADGSQWAELRDRCRRLEEENERLKAAAETAHRAGLSPDGHPTQESRLLLPHLLTAHVLGQQATAFLDRRQLLDVGSRLGAAPQALVAQVPECLLDAGRDRRVQPGGMLLAGAQVWGRIAEVGSCTSTMRSVWQAGYRDVVRLASPGQDPQRGPRGLLESTGDGLPRIRLVEVTQPVAQGDCVYTGADQGVLAEPLLYGHVARLERPVGAAHWEIWMQPAVEPIPPDTLAVLCLDVNPERSGKPIATQAAKEDAR